MKRIISDALRGKCEKAGEALKLAAKMSAEYYGEPLIITYSGGKDSDTVLWLAVAYLEPGEFEVLNSHTTVDAPQTVYHIRDTFEVLQDYGVKCTVKMPTYKGKPVTMWTLIPQKGIPPTRLQRYCCQVLKEGATPHRIIATGVRGSESVGRRGRDVFEERGKKKADARYYSLDHATEVYEEAHMGYGDAWDCQLITAAKKKKNLICNPIYEWTDADVWDYIRRCNIPYNLLYDKGYYRVGCVGCPLGGSRGQRKEFADFPTYKQAYINAFQRMVDERKAHGKETQGRWTDGEAVMKWWLGDVKDGQMSLFDSDIAAMGGSRF